MQKQDLRVLKSRLNFISSDSETSVHEMMTMMMMLLTIMTTMISVDEADDDADDALEDSLCEMQKGDRKIEKACATCIIIVRD